MVLVCQRNKLHTSLFMSHEEFPLVFNRRKAVQFLRCSLAFNFFSEWSPKITKIIFVAGVGYLIEVDIYHKWTSCLFVSLPLDGIIKLIDVYRYVLLIAGLSESIRATVIHQDLMVCVSNGTNVGEQVICLHLGVHVCLLVWS